MANVFTGIFWLLALMFLYFLPYINAHEKGHPQKEAIGCINLFLGWTFIGWVVALAWSCTTQKKE